MDYNSSSSSATTDVAQLDPTGFQAPVMWRVGIFGNAALDVTITLFVALRCYVRFSSRLRLHAEDCMYSFPTALPILPGWARFLDLC